MSSLPRLERQRKKTFSNLNISLLVYYSFGNETIIRSNAPVVSLKNTLFQTKIGVFRPKRGKNRALWGGTYLYGLYKGVPLLPLPPGCVLDAAKLTHEIFLFKSMPPIF